MHHNGFSISGCSLEVSEENEEKLAELIRWYNPTLAVVGMGRSGAAEPNFIAANLLRKAGIRHIVPSAFPSAAAYKMIVVDGASGACYGCIQHKLVIDAGNAPTLTNAQQRMFYGGVQPATVFETYPSVHCLLRLCIELCSSGRRIWFSELLAQEKNCLVGCNRAEQKDGGWVYGVSMPGQVVAYGTADLAGTREFTQCPSCGRSYSVRHKMEV
jgi:hypothetical protein